MKKILFLITCLIFLCSYSYAFSDENTFLWAKDAVNKWYEKGIVGGYGDGTFRGNANITRGELLSIVNRLNRSGETITKRPANDVNEGVWFFNDVGVALKNGLIELDENGNMRPYDYATREETMVILSNLFHLTYSKDAYTYLTSNFSDGYLLQPENLAKVAGVIDFGFVNGYPDGTLRPNRFVTRAEFVAMVNNCIAEIYDEGSYSKQIIPNSIIINDCGVKLANFEVRDKIFVLDGAKEDPPYIVNTNVGKGIHSRIGDIEIKREDYWETITEKLDNEDDKEYGKPLTATIRYSDTTWTDDDVTVTIKLEDSDYKIVNNSRKNKYTFEKNGEFIFVCENSDGKIVKFLTEVECIDKIPPRLTATVEKTETSATITVGVFEDGLSPISKVRYVTGKATVGETLRGTDVIGSFTVTQNGTYTIAAVDEAGNDEKITVIVSGLSQSNTGEGDTTGDNETPPSNNTPPTGGTGTEGNDPIGGETPPTGGTDTEGNDPTGGETPPTGGTDTEGNDPTEGETPQTGGTDTEGNDPVEGETPPAGGTDTEGNDPIEGETPSTGGTDTEGNDPIEGETPSTGGTDTEGDDSDGNQPPIDDSTEEGGEDSSNNEGDNTDDEEVDSEDNEGSTEENTENDESLDGENIEV